VINMKKILLVICLACLSACEPNQEDADIDLSQLQYAGLKNSQLEKVADADKFEQHLKNGIRLRTLDNVIYAAEVDVLVSAEGAAQDSAAASDFSETNVHEAGVDESDIVKYDGQHIFISVSDDSSGIELAEVAQADSLIAPPDYNNKVYIYETDASNASTRLVSQIELDYTSLSTANLYLLKDEQQQASKLITISNSWGAGNSVFFDEFCCRNSEIIINSYNVEDVESPQHEKVVRIEGNLINSRQINNTLFLVSRYTPVVSGLVYFPQTEDEKAENERKIEQADIDSLLPGVVIDNGTSVPHVTADQCFISDVLADNESYQDLLILTAVDLQAGEITDSLCINANVQGIYSSPTSLYVGGSDSNGFWFNNSTGLTVLHKFDLQNNDIVYRASGSVPGYMGWSDSSFRMSEYEGDLRIVTSSRDETGQLQHQLSILSDDAGNNELKIISTLPSESRPEKIGKPGEDIYAVRFQGDRAFIVTFQRTDPLYVLNLSDALNPTIAGELEVPGFSNYLHPVSDDLLLGIGREADAMTGKSRVKLELFDIEDISAPRSINHLLVGESRSYGPDTNLHAMTFLQKSTDELRIALPVSVSDRLTSSGYNNWSHSGLHLFNIEGIASSEASLNFHGSMISEAYSEIKYYSDRSIYNDRSVMHDDSVFYVHGSEVFSELWGEIQ
jgi:uncharacterized secreted protein with C-terminal beta-propeller domain